MITFPKLLLLIGIGLLIWFLLRKTNILGGSRAGAQPRTPQHQKANRQAEGAIEDMVKCPKCSAYVPAKGGHDCRGA